MSENYIYWANFEQFMVYDRAFDKTLLIDNDKKSANGGICNNHIYQLKTIVGKEDKKTQDLKMCTFSINIYDKIKLKNNTTLNINYDNIASINITSLPSPPNRKTN